jgi:tRNA pseudouridine38-40 synthase
MLDGMLDDEIGERRHFRAVVEYDGTDYHGFQFQLDQRSVQGVLEEALTKVTGQSPRVLGAGRTDAGVHARGQVIVFWVRWRHELADLHRAMNAVLARDVALLTLEIAPESFHPRYSARSRWYRYTVLNQPLRSPLSRRWAFHVPKSLSVDRMEQACTGLVGERDFATFGQPPQGSNTVRQILRAEWNCDNRFLYFDVEANAFLHKMVRSLVGTLLQVGFGELSPEEFLQRLSACNRSLAGPTAPPHGLCLMAVNY